MGNGRDHASGDKVKTAKTKYMILGKAAATVTVLRYGVYRNADNAVHRLRDTERGDIKRPSKRIKIHRYLHNPQDTESCSFWIEDQDANNVTKKLLKQFIHNPVNRKMKKMLAWATEQIILRGEGR